MTASKTDVWAYECPLCYATYEPDQAPTDFRCAACDASPLLSEKQSEFGAGVVVCLVKFTEHLGNEQYRRIWKYHRWLEEPTGPSPEAWEESSFHKWPALRGAATTPEEYALHQVIHRWANAAGDHFFDLDRETAPASLIELADLAIELRNSHLADVPRLFTIADVERVDSLWKRAAVDIDRSLGTTPNWGEW